MLPVAMVLWFHGSFRGLCLLAEPIGIEQSSLQQTNFLMVYIPRVSQATLEVVLRKRPKAFEGNIAHERNQTLGSVGDI
jgi:hypothetical protein